LSFEHERSVDACLLLGTARFGSAGKPLALAAKDVLSILLYTLFVLQELRLLLEIIAVPSLKRRQAAALELDDARCDRVEKVPVVGDEHDRAARARQSVLEPRRRVGVQMVGRLVEDRHVRACNEQLRERDAAPFAAASRAAGSIDVSNAELVEKTERFVPALPPAQALHGVVERGLLGEQGVYGAGVGLQAFGHFRVACGRLAPGRQGILDDLAGARIGVKLRLLGQVADREASPHAERAAVGRFEAGQNSHERRLARAVGSDKAHLFAARKGEGGVFQNDLRPKRLS
jgi:hypothetical protein